MWFTAISNANLLFSTREQIKKETIEVSLESVLVPETVSNVINLGFHNLHHYTKGKIQVAHGSSSSLMVNLWKL